MRQLALIFAIFCFSFSFSQGQDIELYQQFNGRFDYTAFGNTLNIVENQQNTPCDILTSSSADLSLESDQSVVAAYLYWAGSGNTAPEIDLNGNLIIAERTFSGTFNSRNFFAAFADITEIIQDGGSGTYTISDFDLTSVITPYCTNGTNFGGWAITVIYEDEDLPLNQLNVYDGLQAVPDNLSITLDNLNVLDNEGAKIGFVAWEGDSNISVQEQLSINGNVIGNPPLNPLNNAFNGTNSFTNASDLYNMDIDVYNIQNNISIGDTTATIELTSGQDFVMINNIITVLNSQLPDATINLESVLVECNDRQVEIDYTVFNLNSTDPLPANTPIAFYADDNLIGQTVTQNTLPIDGSETGTIVILVPEDIPQSFILSLIVDDDGTGNGLITELNETNNTSVSFQVELIESPPLELLGNQLSCDEGFNSAVFDLMDILESNNINSQSDFSFYKSFEDLENETNEILIPESYNNQNNPETIYARVETQPCFSTYSFELLVENCPPTIPEGFSPNTDGKNDWFNIQGLYNIFEFHELMIYNRYGELIFEGNNDNPWLGRTNRGLNNIGVLVPVGTYYYILNLNDPAYKPLIGWVYVNY